MVADWLLIGLLTTASQVHRLYGDKRPENITFFIASCKSSIQIV